MNVHEARNKLRRKNKADLFALALNQGLSKCTVGGRACGFLLHYEGLNFCISEILGRGCQVERFEKSELHCEDLGKADDRLPFPKKADEGPLHLGKEGFEFRVYYRDRVTRSIILLGKVIERRTKERGTNLEHLLVKAARDYADCVADPSMIFLLH
jgi:hypothetical protein